MAVCSGYSEQKESRHGKSCPLLWSCVLERLRRTALIACGGKFAIPTCGGLQKLVRFGLLFRGRLQSVGELVQRLARRSHQRVFFDPAIDTLEHLPGLNFDGIFAGTFFLSVSHPKQSDHQAKQWQLSDSENERQ